MINIKGWSDEQVQNKISELRSKVMMVQHANNNHQLILQLNEMIDMLLEEQSERLYVQTMEEINKQIPDVIEVDPDLRNPTKPLDGPESKKSKDKAKTFKDITFNKEYLNKDAIKKDL